ncbi:hypothetical protein L484_024748 [Morus notabilis]|uniref:Uncharacterized protein n=1 Tax=Morus notabilis TaxID=981085 RepID=W9R4Z1_9ROSA|nr:hypothetical protein L484_024748 [Morus notabilis]
MYLKGKKKEKRKTLELISYPPGSHPQSLTVLDNWRPFPDSFCKPLEGINDSISNLRRAFHSKCYENGANRRKAQRKSSGEKFLSLLNDDLVESMPPTNCRGVDDNKCPAENTFASSIETSSKVGSSPFEFYVWSEEGIDLYVDLNSSPSEWTQKFKNEVHKFENVQNNKSRSLHEDLGYLKEGDKEMRSSFWNIHAREIRDEPVDTRSSPSLKMTKDDHSVLDQPKKGETYSISLAIQPCGASPDVSDESKVDQHNKSSDLDSSAQDHIISVAESCAKDGCTMNCGAQDHIISVAESCSKDGCTTVLGSDIIDAHDIKSLHDTAVNSIYSDPLSPVISEHPNSDLIQCQNTILENDSSLINLSVACRGCSVSSSMEFQSSEVASCNKDASCSRCESGFIGGFATKDNIETEKGRLANTSELNPDANGCHLPVPGEEQTCFSSDNTETREGLKRKRYVEDKNQMGNAIANTKVLRSMKRLKDLPRRSMRLMSKDAAILGKTFILRTDSDFQTSSYRASALPVCDMIKRQAEVRWESSNGKYMSFAL